jgi:hypothetical protein
MKRPSYLQQIVPAAPGRYRTGAPLLAPSPPLFRPSSADVQFVETDVVTRSALMRSPLTAPQADHLTVDAAGIARHDTREPIAPATARVVARPSPEIDVSTAGETPRLPRISRDGPDLMRAQATPIRNARLRPFDAQDGAGLSLGSAASGIVQDRPVPETVAANQAALLMPMSSAPDVPTHLSQNEREPARATALPGAGLLELQTARPTHDEKTGKFAVAARLPQISPPAAPPQLPVASNRGAGEQRSLHIGTLEVRVIAPPPTAPAPDAPVRAARRNSGPKTRIGRGFGVFGLGQS